MDTPSSNSGVERTLDRILDKLQEQGELLARHTVLHEKNTEDLERHIKRTDALEDRMEQHAKAHDGKLEEALLPIRFVKMLVAVSLGSAAIYGLLQLINQIMGK